MLVSNQQTFAEIPRRSNAIATGSEAATPNPIFVAMVEMAQDPALLPLFYPYLPRTWRSHAGLVKATKIASWRKQILVGESQVSKSAIMAYVWDRAPDRDKLNEELCKLGFVGLMQQ